MSTDPSILKYLGYILKVTILTEFQMLHFISVQKSLFLSGLLMLGWLSAVHAGNSPAFNLPQQANPIDKSAYSKDVIIVRNPDGSSVQTLPDGSKVVINADGTTLQTNPDGTQIIQQLDGSIMVKSPDGTLVVKNPDGSSVETKPNGIKIIKNVDGSVIRLNKKGDRIIEKAPIIIKQAPVIIKP